MKRIVWMWIVCALLSLSACGLDEGEMLFLRSAGADMPVWVRGNASSDALVLVVHGGPGGSSFTLYNAPAFQSLEARYGVAYWEQRGSGMAQGHAATDTLTVAQFRDDLDDVVDLLRTRYPARRLYLLGYSWGGLLSALYLTDPAAQAKVRGWIDVAGSVDVPRSLSLGRQWAIDAAQRRVDAGDDAARWREALAWYAANPTIDHANLDAHLGYVGALGGGSTTGRSAVTGSVIFGSPFDPFTMSANGAHTLHAMFPEVERINAAPGLRAVTLPALVMGGDADGHVPLAVDEEVYDALGTAEVAKELVRVPHGAHALHLDAPEVYVDHIARFIDRTR